MQENVGLKDALANASLALEKASGAFQQGCDWQAKRYAAVLPGCCATIHSKVSQLYQQVLTNT